MPGGHGPGGTCWGDRAAEGGWRERRAERGVHAARGGGRRRRVARGRLGGPRGQGRGGVATGRRPCPAFRPLLCPRKRKGRRGSPRRGAGWLGRGPPARSAAGVLATVRHHRPQVPRVHASRGNLHRRLFRSQEWALRRAGAQASLPRGGSSILLPPTPKKAKGPVRPWPSCSPVLARRQGTESRGRRWALLKPAGPRQRHLASACSLARGPLRSRGARAPPHCALHGQPAGAHSPGPAPDPSPGAVRAHSACRVPGHARHREQRPRENCSSPTDKFIRAFPFSEHEIHAFVIETQKKKKTLGKAKSLVRSPPAGHRGGSLAGTALHPDGYSIAEGPGSFVPRHSGKSRAGDSGAAVHRCRPWPDEISSQRRKCQLGGHPASLNPDLRLAG